MEAKGRQHRRRNRNGRTETGHAFHEGTESPGNEKCQDAAVFADCRKHMFDNIHTLRMHGEIIRKNGRDDNQ